MNKTAVILFVSLASSAPVTMAFNQCPVHTWHDVISSAGTWNITLKMISEEGVLVDKFCQPVNNIRITPATPLVYGFGFTDKATFDIAYTVTAISDETSFKSKTCVFVVTANGPAQPDIHAISYYGAKCDWQVIPGVGENFTVG